MISLKEICEVLHRFNDDWFKEYKNYLEEIIKKDDAFCFYCYLFRQNVRLYLITVFIFYFQKLVFGNIKKKQFSCIFEIKNMFD